MEKLLSVREYAVKHNVSHTQVYTMIGDGRISKDDVIIEMKPVIRLKDVPFDEYTKNTSSDA